MKLGFKNSDSGSARSWMIISIALIVGLVLALVFGIWSFVQYQNQKTDVDSRIDAAVTTARKEQVDTDEAKYLERDKQPMRAFTGPDDYGQLSFNYPKTWSVYVDRDASSGGNYEAYFNPKVVPPVSSSQQFALRVVIEEKDFDKVLSGYDSLVKKGDLKSSSVTINGTSGTRLDGSFSKDIRGSAVLFKIRDKTVTIRTDADTFRVDFDALIQTIKFNQ
ncbi:hypothetical protein HGB24_02825 [Candidatus Saccharibacteria bacterium]|nr:hypothetical protein [Candidatus Saccharibacteria bacterium]